jgi:hypothetical protein
MEQNENIVQQIESLKENVRKNKIKNNIIIILVIIIIFLLCLLGQKLGKIGYSTIETYGAGIENSTDLNVIKITDTDLTLELGKNVELNIFNNSKFNGEKIIAPHSMGIYQFYVKNEMDNNITYNIRILDGMSNFVNMKYKLKLNNVYICGTKDKYVSIEELNLDDIILTNNSTSLYTLEWYWEDDDQKDTYVGGLKSDEYYTLRLNIQLSKIDD